MVSVTQPTGLTAPLTDAYQGGPFYVYGQFVDEKYFPKAQIVYFIR